MINVSSLYFSSPSPTVAALGCFDGVHIGHAEVIRQAKKEALRRACDCTVWTFSEPVKNFFSPNSVPLITSTKQKNELIEKLGADIFVSIQFDSKIGNMSAEDFFISILKERLKACHIVCGYNYTFGKMGIGNVELLRQHCDKYGIGLTVVPSINIYDTPVSSSEIRKAISNGNIELACQMLGRPYSISAPVINGQHLARTLGFPTVNQVFPDNMVIPKHGVYATKIRIENDDSIYYGITNVGNRPTIGGTPLCAETHIFDISKDLYGSNINLEFLSFLRSERKFESLEELAHQVMKDISEAKHFLANRHNAC